MILKIKDCYWGVGGGGLVYERRAKKSKIFVFRFFFQTMQTIKKKSPCSCAGFVVLNHDMDKVLLCASPGTGFLSFPKGGFAPKVRQFKLRFLNKSK